MVIEISCSERWSDYVKRNDLEKRSSVQNVYMSVQNPLHNPTLKILHTPSNVFNLYAVKYNDISGRQNSIIFQ